MRASILTQSLRQIACLTALARHDPALKVCLCHGAKLACKRAAASDLAMTVGDRRGCVPVGPHPISAPQARLGAVAHHIETIPAKADVWPTQSPVLNR